MKRAQFNARYAAPIKARAAHPDFDLQPVDEPIGAHAAPGTTSCESVTMLGPAIAEQRGHLIARKVVGKVAETKHGHAVLIHSWECVEPLPIIVGKAA